MMEPYEEYVLLSLARRFATGDALVEKDVREAVKCLREVLRNGSDDARFEAWKIVDSGVVGNRIVFLLFRFRDWATKGKTMRRYGLPVVWPFSAELTYHYAEVLLWSRICLIAAEVLVILVLLMNLSF
jgi:hypothetical protein